jgi:hypothetical protein
MLKIMKTKIHTESIIAPSTLGTLGTLVTLVTLGTLGTLVTLVTYNF